MPRKNALILAACVLAIIAAGAMIWRSLGGATPAISDDMVKRNAEATQGAEAQSQPEPGPARPSAGPGGRQPGPR